MQEWNKWKMVILGSKLYYEKEKKNSIIWGSLDCQFILLWFSLVLSGMRKGLDAARLDPVQASFVEKNTEIGRNSLSKTMKSTSAWTMDTIGMPECCQKRKQWKVQWNLSPSLEYGDFLMRLWRENLLFSECWFPERPCLIGGMTKHLSSRLFKVGKEIVTEIKNFLVTGNAKSCPLFIKPLKV